MILPDSTGCGPTSRNTRSPESITAVIASANRTGSRTFAHQYSAPQSGPVTWADVTVEYSGTIGVRGARLGQRPGQLRQDRVHQV